MPRPLARARRGRAGPFGALLVAATQDPTAVRGLALAYASLHPGARQRIVEAVVDDAHAEGISISAVLAALLAVEEDADVARSIAELISAEGGAGLEPSVRPRALSAGDADCGGVVLIRPLHGTFTEVLALAWRPGRGVTHAVFDPLVHDGDAAGHVQHLPAELGFEETPVGFAIDLVAPVLWSHRRTYGTLPPGVRRFADLFSIQASPDIVLDNL